MATLPKNTPLNHLFECFMGVFSVIVYPFLKSLVGGVLSKNLLFKHYQTLHLSGGFVVVGFYS